ncbi:MAG TPA: helix-turn-helix domain-containing protein [Candidatus Nanopelagicaceae bacterium]
MSVGILLRQARESAGMSIEELSQETRIPRKILNDLEKDDFQSCGGVAYARGHIRSIAKALHANSDLLVDEFNLMNQEFDRPMIDLLSENSATPIPRMGTKVSFGLMAKVAVVVVALLVAIPTAASFVNKPAKTPAKTSTTNVVTPPTTAPVTSSPGSLAVATVTSQVSVVVTASLGTTWLAVTDSSGTQIFSGMLEKGATKTFDDSQLINVTIGNAGAVDLNVNSKDIGAPGTTGEVVHLQFGPGASSQG